LPEKQPGELANAEKGKLSWLLFRLFVFLRRLQTRLHRFHIFCHCLEADQTDQACYEQTGWGCGEKGSP
jgi:hypothetical protein